ncbi:hypothetical protein SAMN04487850_0949 [Prevotella aff. ruminicola Tc2-24]|jgi:hypothetical protein|uniref:Cell division protein FtsL n=1 Tax=Prevotella aff. ruminicola Tc2-24 TaxID=81582 RepID=A0A1I0N5M8_9BACT|nr:MULTISPECIES: FtsL-like putative cell division protein [Prevotella]MBR5988554.1 hypothetical protein [Prevotella sp.]SEE54903.1 hypothetical protein SAMN04487828_2056 [Prevotella sp. lc2012]SEV95660.1 hypothetical protein SAMN04487850_0949 [Prevotella aff. ruminicola Tc2-24]
MRKNDDIELKIEDTTSEAIQEEERSRDEAAEMREQARKAIQMIKETVREEDPKLTPTLTLRTILGGDFLTADMVRRNIWLFVLMVIFTIVYVAVRYQCQQDMIAIDKLEKELLDAKYKALSSSSTLTEKCRESHVLHALKQNKDSLLHIADQPPYIINVPE